MNRFPKIMLLVMLVSGLIVTGCSSPAPAQGPQIGKLAPDFQLSSLDGQVMSLSDFRGKPVLLNFWATWCGPCRFEMPFLQTIHEEWSDRGLVVLAIDIQESPERVREFADSFGLSLPILLATSPEVPLAYNIRAIPTTFFIDENGIIRDIKVGAFANKTEIERRLSKIIR